MSRTILDVLGISKADLERFAINPNRRYRSFLKKGKTVTRMNKHKVDQPGLYYNIAYGWTSKELHREYNAIDDVQASDDFRQNIIRIEYVCKFGCRQKKTVYVDAREIAGILQLMGYKIQPNKKFNANKMEDVIKERESKKNKKVSVKEEGDSSNEKESD